MRTILLTTLNSVGSKTFFNAVFNSSEQVVRFWLGIAAVCTSVCCCFLSYVLHLREMFLLKLYLSFANSAGREEKRPKKARSIGLSVKPKFSNISAINSFAILKASKSADGMCFINDN